MAVENVFNEQWYVRNYPDVAEAVQQGLITAYDHFHLFGKHEGRTPGPLFDPAHYLAQNPDVAAAVEAGLITAYDHFQQFGASESRVPVPYFDAQFYLQQNPDIAAGVEQDLFSAVEHFMLYGQAEPRALSPFFDLSAYVAANPDIAEAVAAGLINPLDHLINFGVTEGRDLGNGVSLALFQNDPQFQAVMQGGNVLDALARVAQVAPFLPTFEPPAGWTPPPDTPIPLDFVPPEGVTLVIPPAVEVPPGVDLPDAFEPVPPAPTPAPPEPPAPEPAEPEGGGPVQPPARTFTATVTEVDGVPVVSFSGSARGNISMKVDEHGVATFSRQNIRADTTVQLSEDDLVKVSLADSQKLVVAGGDLNGLNVNFVGGGSVDITGVAINESYVDGSGDSAVAQLASVNADLWNVLHPNVKGRLSDENATVITINNSAADYFITNWIYLDSRYYENWPETYAGDLDLSIAKADLALLYVDYLENGGDETPFMQFVAKTAVDENGVPTREQWIHDNFLGELWESALHGRFGVAEAEEGLLEHYLEAAGAYADRAYHSGNFVDWYGTAHKQAMAFDYEQGWNRGDYERTILKGTLDAIATDDNEMWMGDGNSITGFTLARHEGAGVELALKPKERMKGNDYEPIENEEGLIIYKVDPGSANTAASWGTPARWSLDFSVATGLNGATSALDDFTFKLHIDVDPSEDIGYVEFRLLPGNNDFNLGRVWLQMTPDGAVALNDGVPAGGFDYALEDDDAVNEHVSQNSVNFGFGFMRELLAQYGYANPEPAPDEPDDLIGDFGSPAYFDILLQAVGDAGVLLENHIQIQVTDII